MTSLTGPAPRLTVHVGEHDTWRDIDTPDSTEPEGKKSL
jgi:hypothetical protein